LVREAELHTLSWLEQFNLLPSPQWKQHYEQSKITLFAARCFPQASCELLCLASDMNIWLFLLDDYLERIPVNRKLPGTQQMIHQFQQVISHFPISQGPRPDLPLIQAFEDLWKRFGNLSTHFWMSRLYQALLHYWDGCMMEALLHDEKHTPSVDLYLQQRPYLGAVHLETCFADLLEGCLPETVWRHPDIQQLSLLCAGVVCWSNDLFSLQKEMRGDASSLNLVLILRDQEHLTLEDAIRRTAAKHDSDLELFEQIRDHLPYFRTQSQGQVQRYIQQLEHIISANMHWSTVDSNRYNPQFEPMV
jgi:5-epi-alpha-selinene synthase